VEKAKHRRPASPAAAASGMIPQSRSRSAKEPSSLPIAAADLRARTDVPKRSFTGGPTHFNSRTAKNFGVSTGAQCVGSVSMQASSHMSARHFTAVRDSSNSTDNNTSATLRPKQPTTRTVETGASFDSTHASYSRGSRPQHEDDRRGGGRPIAQSENVASRTQSSETINPMLNAKADISLLKKKLAFNTCKQQFSSMKPTTSLPLQSNHTHLLTHPVPMAKTVSRSDVAELQDELTQLSLLHRSSRASLDAYTYSIDLKLQTRREAVESHLIAWRTLEDDLRGRINALAISKWLQDIHLYGASGKEPDVNPLPLLGFCLKELHDVSGESGAFENILRVFDAISRRSIEEYPVDLIDEQEHGEGHEGFEVEITRPMQWPASRNLQDRVAACAATLTDLERPAESSAIGLTIQMHLRLAKQMLVVLQTSEYLENTYTLERQKRVHAAVEEALLGAERRHAADLIQARPRWGVWHEPDLTVR
jgi:hypothetical protein